LYINKNIYVHFFIQVEFIVFIFNFYTHSSGDFESYGWSARLMIYAASHFTKGLLF